VPSSAPSVHQQIPNKYPFAATARHVRHRQPQLNSTTKDTKFTKKKKQYVFRRVNFVVFAIFVVKELTQIIAAQCLNAFSPKSTTS
jgi:hypothetical protein